MDKLKVLNRVLCCLALVLIMTFPGLIAVTVGAVATLCQAMATVLFGGVAMALCSIWCMCLAFPTGCAAVGMLLLLALSESRS